MTNPQRNYSTLLLTCMMSVNQMHSLYFVFWTVVLSPIRREKAGAIETIVVMVLCVAGGEAW